MVNWEGCIVDSQPIVFVFEKLELYQRARAFRQRIYKLTRMLPPDEFKLKIQMRDAARSMTNCIAEGHGRYTFKDRTHFCRESRGSLQELVDDINIFYDQAYAKPEHLDTLRIDAHALLMTLNGYINYLKKCAANQNKRPETRTSRSKSQLTT
jgi:four helix bundle protein